MNSEILGRDIAIFDDEGGLFSRPNRAFNSDLRHLEWIPDHHDGLSWRYLLVNSDMSLNYSQFFESVPGRVNPNLKVGFDYKLDAPIHLHLPQDLGEAQRLRELLEPFILLNVDLSEVPWPRHTSFIRHSDSLNYSQLPWLKYNVLREDLEVRNYVVEAFLVGSCPYKYSKETLLAFASTNAIRATRSVSSVPSIPSGRPAYCRTSSVFVAISSWSSVPSSSAFSTNSSCSSVSWFVLRTDEIEEIHL